MHDARVFVSDWAGARRRRWSASRGAAALALHAGLLVALILAIDRVALPRHGVDRATTLVDVVLHPVPAPAQPLRLARANAPATHAPAARPVEQAARAITLAAQPPADPAPAVAAATPPASSPSDLSFLNSAATRQAIRAVARGDTLASHGNALTHEEPGSELVAADGSHQDMQRNLPAPPPAVALAQGIDAAHKGDCMKGDYLGAGMGLLSAPFLLANEMLGKCAHKL